MRFIYIVIKFKSDHDFLQYSNKIKKALIMSLYGNPLNHLLKDFIIYLDYSFKRMLISKHLKFLLLFQSESFFFDATTPWARKNYTFPYETIFVITHSVLWDFSLKATVYWIEFQFFLYNHFLLTFQVINVKRPYLMD